MRTPIIAGNWKMNKTQEEARQFVKDIQPLIKNQSVQVMIAPTYTAITATAEAAKGSSLIVGAQNMNAKEEGAFTGEISPAMIKDAGARFVILGHSERRQLFGETDSLVHSKLISALQAGITPILCIGETGEERESGHTERVLETQLTEALKDLSDEQKEKVIIAYEPVWAIGTGKTATPEMAQEAHHFCRSLLGRVAENISILYGGSVKPETIQALIAMPDIDGALVGGASLKPDVFAQIINHVPEGSR